MAQAREHALLAGPPTTTCSRSDAIQSSGKPEALHNIAAPLPKFGVLALARLRPLWMTQAREHALLADPPTTTCSRSDAIQSSGKPEALHNIAAPLPKFGVLALARLRPLWMTQAREHALLAGPTIPLHFTGVDRRAHKKKGAPESALQKTVGGKPRLPDWPGRI